MISPEMSDMSNARTNSSFWSQLVVRALSHVASGTVLLFVGLWFGGRNEDHPFPRPPVVAGAPPVFPMAVATQLWTEHLVREVRARSPYDDEPYSERLLENARSMKASALEHVKSSPQFGPEIVAFIEEGMNSEDDRIHLLQDLRKRGWQALHDALIVVTAMTILEDDPPRIAVLHRIRTALKESVGEVRRVPTDVQ